jgi:hypothetical protein
MELEHEFDFWASLKPPVVIGPGPFGMRMFFELIEGKASGPRISGSVLGGGGDWILVGPDGWGRIDVRAQLALDDGAVVLVSYFGVLELNSKVMEAMGTQEGTDFADQYFRITPRFETGDDRYAWLSQGVFVGEGRVYPGGGVEYRIYRVT